MFFVSVASKGLSPGVRLLFATLTFTGRFIRVADKGVVVNKNRGNVGRSRRCIRDGSERGNGEGSGLCSRYTKKDSMEVYGVSIYLLGIIRMES
jgi:hypothetical protein